MERDEEASDDHADHHGSIADGIRCNLHGGGNETSGFGLTREEHEIEQANF